MDEVEPRRHDVAISFLSGDEDLAQELHDRLSPSLDVFLYTERQQDVAGTDGLETFRAIYLERARLVVVLYRDGWGETPWTRVERQAIEERFLKAGPAFLFWMPVARKSTPPPWLPEQLIRFELEDFGLEQAVGAIKARAREAGSQFRRETPADEAKRLQDLQRFQAERQALFGSDSGVRAAAQEVARLFEAITAQVASVRAAAPDLQMDAGHDSESMVLRSRTCAVGVYWYCHYANNLRESALQVRQFQGHLTLPGQRGQYAFREPTLVAEDTLQIDLIRSRGWCWRREDGDHLSSEQLAEYAVKTLLALVRRVDAGELPPHR